MASRRAFITALAKPLESVAEEKREHIVRPPYGKSEASFATICVACESTPCVGACEEGIILIRADHTPMLNFTQRGCTFCEACAKACPTEVLSLDYPYYREKINAKFVIIPQACVAHNGVICFACKEPCIDDAILFNGMFNPVIDPDRCTACGYCMARCPTKAIAYTALEIEEEKYEAE